MQNYLFGVDVGSSTLKGAVWRAEKGAGRLAAYAKIPTEGVKRGVVQDVDEVASGLTKLTEELEKMSGVELERAVVGVGGVHLENRPSKGTVIVARSDKVVTEEDITRVHDMAKSYAIAPNRETLHIIPRSYALDGVGGLRDPIGMEGYHLDLESYVVDALVPALRFLERAFELAGIEREMLVASPLAAARAVLTKRDQDVGSVAVDIGGDTTSIGVFEEDTLSHLAVLPIGSSNVTNDIALALKIPIEAAEAIKIDVATVMAQKIEKRDSITLSRYVDGANENISKRFIADIIQARAEEILEYVANELKKIDKLGKLAGGAVFLGGGARLQGIETLAKKELRMPARIATLDHLARFLPESCDLEYLTVCGLVLYGLDERGELQSSRTSFWGRLRKIADIFIP